jgi:hypothetical protein
MHKEKQMSTQRFIFLGIIVIAFLQSCITYQLPSKCKLSVIDDGKPYEGYYLTGQVYGDSEEDQNKVGGASITLIADGKAYSTYSDIDGLFLISVPKTAGRDRPTLVVSSGWGYYTKIIHPLKLTINRKNHVVIILEHDPSVPSV